MIRNQLDLFVFYLRVYIAIESSLFYGFCRIKRKLTQKWRVSSVQKLKLTLIKCKLVSTWNSLNLLIIAVVQTYTHIDEHEKQYRGVAICLQKKSCNKKISEIKVEPRDKRNKKWLKRDNFGVKVWRSRCDKDVFVCFSLNTQQKCSKVKEGQNLINIVT